MNTKSISFFGLGLLAAAALSSCDHIEEATGKPVVNPQEPIFTDANVEYVALPYIDASVEDMGEEQVAFVNVEGLPAGFSVYGILELSNTEDFKKVIEVPLTTKGKYMYVSVSDVAAQYSDKFTLNPDPVDLFGRTRLYASSGTDAVRLGDPGTYFGEMTYIFTPVPAAEAIAASYYIIMGNGTEWDYRNAVKLEHSDKNQYDDPNFTAVIKEVPELGSKWIVMSDNEFWPVRYEEKTLAESVYYTPVYDRTADGKTYGDLEKNGPLDANMLPSIDAPCLMSINMRTKGYDSAAALEAYYVTGEGWSGWGTHWMELTTENYSDYRGFLNLGSQFKFAPQAGWGGDFGGSAPEENVKDGVYSYIGTCHDTGDNISINHAGLYFCQLNATKWTYTLQGINSWGLIGDFNSRGGDVVMTPSPDLYKWTAELTVSEGQGWKFRANGDWSFNLGGTSKNLVNGGDNIVLPEGGTYKITLDLRTYPAKFTAVRKY